MGRSKTKTNIITPAGKSKYEEVGPRKKVQKGAMAFKNQKYSSLKKEFSGKGELFTDPEFPANNKSLFYSKVDNDIEWKRPQELCKVPRLVVEGVACEDLNEGELGSSWFVTACSSLAQEPKLWQKVVPNHKEQEWSDQNSYAGIFHFQFWRYGQWIDVVIDDLLPTKNGKLCFVHSKSRNEFWSALLEKAYAKLYGDYESLASGCVAEALVDFTGGVSEAVILDQHDITDDTFKNKLFADLQEAIENHSLVTCTIAGVPSEEGEDGGQGLIRGHGYGVLQANKISLNKAVQKLLDTTESQLNMLRLRNPWGTREWTGAWSDEYAVTLYLSNPAFCGEGEAGETTPEGLVKGHGYGVTDVRMIELHKAVRELVGGVSKLYLLRVRNPWGNREWTGAWSDDSKEWNSLSQKDRDKLGIKFEQEGEFWMSFDDFVNNFTSVDLCHFVNTAFFTLKKSWTETMLHGEWLDGARGSEKDRAGGDKESPTFLYNPQYLFDVPQLSDVIMVALEQDCEAVNAKKVGASHREIGFHVMKVEENRVFRVHLGGEPVFTTDYLPVRSVYAKINLPKGRYVLLPTTKQPGQVARYLLRMYTGSQANPRLLVKEHPKSALCSKPFAAVTTVKVLKVTGLLEAAKGTTDPFVIVKCEGETVKSTHLVNKTDAEFNFKCIFYRKKLDQPVTIEVVNHNTISNDFLGLATISDNGKDTPTEFELDMFGKSKKELEVQKPGKVHVEVTTSHDLTDL